MTGEPTRRQVLGLVGIGALATAAGAVGWRVLGPGSPTDTVAGDPLVEPAVLGSAGGSLTSTLRAARGVTLAGRTTQAFGYNGSSPGPTLRLRPGDTLRLTVRNDLDEPTNLHTHGLHVSPEGLGDNVFRTIDAGEDAAYEYRLAADHPTGTFWYHPHHHGHVADQVYAGLAGAIVVTGDDEPQVDQDRVLVVTDTTLTASGEVAGVTRADVMAGRQGDLVMVNGQLTPRIDVTAGTVQRWRVVNACSSRFLDLRLDGQVWGLLGHDGQALASPVERDSVLLAPGGRADLLVRPSVPGTTTLRTLRHDRGAMGMGMGMSGSAISPETVLATVQVTGPAAAQAAWPTLSRAVPDLRGATVDRRRTVTFTMGMGMGMGAMAFGFDGRSFDMVRTDQTLALGTVEEWTLANPTPMDHPFHLHVWPMQVVDDGTGAGAAGEPDWRDVVVVPAGTEVTVRIPVRDIGGRTVYHCHVLDHEDLGMMGVVEAR